MRFRPMVVFLAALALAACDRDGAPPLIQVSQVSPRDAEIGDRLVITGGGFPAGKPARVTFRGMLHRPGERPTDGAEIDADGVVVAPERVEVTVTDALQAQFCGVGPRAAHTTFSGNVEIAFAAASIGAPPVAGSVGGITLDLNPAGAADARSEEGARALAFLGLKAASGSPASSGVLVDAVEPGSRAEAAGLLAGDLVVSFDELRVASATDMLPSPGASVVPVGVRRGTDPRVHTKRLSVEGFKPAPPSGLVGAAGFIAAAAAFVLLFFAPTGRTRAWLERRLAGSLTGRRRGAPRAAWNPVAQMLTSRPALPLALAAVTGVFAVMPFSQYLIAADLDIGILFVAAVTSLLAVAFVTGGGARYSLLASLRQVAQLLGSDLVAAVAVVYMVIVTGSLRTQDIVRAQGGAPWEWGVFRGPATVVLVSLFAAAVLGVGVCREPPGGGATPAERARTRAFAFAERMHLLVMCALAAALYFGGWQLPGLRPVEQESRAGLQVLGCGLFLAKTWGLWAAGTWLRAAIAGFAPRDVLVATHKYLVPASLAAAGASLGLQHVAVFREAGGGVQALLGVATFVATAMGITAVVQGVRYQLKTKDAAAHLNPFL